jgi:hypothetical protein
MPSPHSPHRRQCFHSRFHRMLSESISLCSRRAMEMQQCCSQFLFVLSR